MTAANFRMLVADARERATLGMSIHPNTLLRPNGFRPADEGQDIRSIHHYRGLRNIHTTPVTSSSLPLTGSTVRGRTAAGIWCQRTAEPINNYLILNDSEQFRGFGLTPPYWNNPNGWRELVKFLKETGYRVICIDQKPSHGTGIVWNQIPYGAEDETGDRPLDERVRWLRHSAFFVGLSSGLAWLAWACETPVVMISGFTHPTNEFDTPYRVINYHTCNSCWNDVRVRFDHKDFLWCPRQVNTPRQFECTRLITAEQVKATIRRIPGFGAQNVAVFPTDRLGGRLEAATGDD